MLANIYGPEKTRSYTLDCNKYGKFVILQFKNSSHISRLRASYGAAVVNVVECIMYLVTCMGCPFPPNSYHTFPKK